MATAAEVQAQLDTTGLAARILRNDHAGAKENYYVEGGVGYAGRCLWVETTASESAADQAAAITTAMRKFSS